MESSASRISLDRSPSARRRTQEEDEQDAKEEQKELEQDGVSMKTNSTTVDTNTTIEVPKKSYQVHAIHQTEHHASRNRWTKFMCNSAVHTTSHASDRENFVSFSNSSFEMTQTSLSQWSTEQSSAHLHSSATTKKNDDFAHWARRYLYGFHPDQASVQEPDSKIQA